MNVLDEIVQDVCYMLNRLECHGPVDRTRLAFRITKDEAEEIRQTMRQRGFFSDYSPEPTEMSIVGIKLIVDRNP